SSDTSRAWHRPCPDAPHVSGFGRRSCANSGPPPAVTFAHATALAAAEAADVVRQTDEEQHQNEHDSHDRDALVAVARERLAADSLDEREGDVAAVERQQWQQVQEREREEEEGEQEQVVLQPLA